MTIIAFHFKYLIPISLGHNSAFARGHSPGSLQIGIQRRTKGGKVLLHHSLFERWEHQVNLNFFPQLKLTLSCPRYLVQFPHQLRRGGGQQGVLQVDQQGRLLHRVEGVQLRRREAGYLQKRCAERLAQQRHQW